MRETRQSLGDVGSQAEPANQGVMSMRSLICLLISASFVVTAAADGRLTDLNVYPPDINLNTKADQQRFIVVATRDDGVTLDVTAQSQIKLLDPKLCRLDGDMLYPQAD